MIELANVDGKDKVKLSESEYRIVVNRSISRIQEDKDDNEITVISELEVQVDILQAT